MYLRQAESWRGEAQHWRKLARQYFAVGDLTHALLAMDLIHDCEDYADRDTEQSGRFA